MNAILKQYLERRLSPVVGSAKPVKTMTGPVITLSREYGCPAKKLAATLTNKLESSGYGNSQEKWFWVGKEIMEESAKELHLKKSFITEIANADEPGIIEDILLTFSNKYYPGDLKIKRTIADIIHSYAATGHVIIVGRGAVSLCRNIKNSLHIKLMAPLEWRINDVSRKDEISLEKAEKKIREIDQKRLMLREHFAGAPQNDSIFDVVFNFMTCSEEEISNSIVRLMEYRGMI